MIDSHTRPDLTKPPGDPARIRHRQELEACWDEIASRAAAGRPEGVRRPRVIEVCRSLVPPGKRVLEIGCGPGDLLAALRPSVGVGVDLSGRMIERAARSHPALRFIQMDASELELPEPFDFVILSDVLHELWDPLEILQVIRRHTTPRSRLIIENVRPLWGPVLYAARRSHSPAPPPSWLGGPDVTNLLGLAGFETVRVRREVLMPLPVPLLTTLVNRYLARTWPLSVLTLTQIFVARPAPLHHRGPDESPPRVSVIIPARNEEGTISSIFDRTPEMGAGTEMIFVEGGSRDDTYGAIERGIARHPARRCKLLRSDGDEKGDAVRLGFAHATGDVLMILDSDLAVAPEDLPKFVDALSSGVAEFANGSRLVLTMEGGAMRPLNRLANWLFGRAFSWVLGQRVTDTLCGTKVLWRADYEELAANRAYFGDLDPFADFDLLLGAARLNLRIVDVPVRYRSRVYGTTNIDRWRHGALLLRMLLLAARKLLFI
jgi:SAM-dependent methyltransferase